MCGAAGSVHAAAAYDFVTLGTLAQSFSPFSASVASGINNAGQIVGYDNGCVGQFTPCALSPAVLWQPDTQAVPAFQAQTLGYLGSGSQASAAAISSGGTIVGVSDTSSVKFATTPHAASWNGTNATDLGVVGTWTESSARGVNGLGQIVGFAGSQFTGSQAVLWSGGSASLLPSLGGSSSVALGINDAGEVVGQSTTGSGASHATAWVGGVPTDLGTFAGGVSSTAVAVNASGVIVGNGVTASGDTHAIAWSGGSAVDIGAVLGGYSVALGVNSAGQIVGRSGTGATLWVGGVAVDLNALLADSLSPGGWQLVDASGINDNGWIVGSATSSLTGQTMAYALIPSVVPEPATAASMLFGMALLGVLRRRRSQGTSTAPRDTAES